MTEKKRCYGRALLIAVVCLWAQSFAEKFDLEVYATRFDSIPVAVLPFRSLNNSVISENAPWTVIADDLAFSGRFLVTRTDKLDSVLIAEKQIGIFIDGEYTVVGQSVILDCYLHDAATGDLIVGKKYRGEKKFMRQMSHRYANEIYSMLFAEKGVFETKILFVKDTEKRKNVYLMDYDGYNQKLLTKNKSVNVFPTFIDSSSILWTSFLRGKPDIYRGSIETGKWKILLYGRYVETSPAVSPIDGRIAFASSRKGNMEIFLADASGGNVRQVTFDRSIDTSPCWSPNGYQIAFTSDRSGQPQIYIMDADGANIHRLTFQGKYQDSPAWSPKGDQIAYMSFVENKFDVWVIGVDGSEPRKVTSTPGHNGYPSWSPNGSHIVFQCERGGRSSLYAIRPDGNGVTALTNSGNSRMPDWSPF
jgi:TolB protein